MSFDRYLDQDELMSVCDAAAKAGFYPEKRDFLLGGLSYTFVGRLKQRSSPTDQLLGDLQQMNEIEYLDGDVVPLVVWLRNAIAHSITPPQRELFRATLDDVAEEFAARLAARASSSTGFESPAEMQLERVVHQNDLLPVGFLAAASKAAESVARLLVTRLENGAEVPRWGRPVRYFGSGWLISKRHLVTNHHVVNGRGDEEADASEDDLRAQTKAMIVQFDYDEEGLEGREVKVDDLLAWNRRGQLDYAIVRLAEDAGEPLELASRVPSLDPTETLAVNIVQHPGGAPKQIGIRNNVLHEVGDRDLRYFTDTMGGSSGSPIFDDGVVVVGLHKATAWLPAVDFQGKPTSTVNLGTRIDRIIEDLTANHTEVWNEIRAHR